ncbi:MAG: nuclear transport factor 2 family protein, partial [Pseudomonadales bacterium]
MNIADTISRFANSLDQKDWAGLASVLAERITVDYSDLRGTKGVVTRAEYISLRAEALSELKTHHLLTNLETREESGVGRCKASALIYRMLGGKFFHSHVIYEFELMGEDDRVEITGI